MSAKEGRRVIDAIGANMVLRIGSFAMSMVLTRLSSPESRGMCFQADVVTNTVGFLAREAIRCLYPMYGQRIRKARGEDGAASRRRQAEEVAKLIALSLCIIPIALCLLLVMEYGGVLMPIPSVSTLAFVQESPNSLPVMLWVGGLVIEWLAEPLAAMAITSQSFKARVVAEALALAFSKAAAITALKAASATMNTYPAYLVGIQQMVYGLVTIASLYRSVFMAASPTEAAPSEGVSLYELKTIVTDSIRGGSKAGGGTALPSLMIAVAATELRRQASEWRSYFSESCLRLVLTEGEKYILTSYVAISGQGVFDVVNTLGSLVARLIFKVWEEGSFNVWKAKVKASLDGEEGSMVAPTAASSSGANAALMPDSLDKLTDAERTAYRNCVSKECVPILSSLIRICAYIGALALLVVQPLPRIGLTLLFSSRWATDDATSVLRVFCAYIPLMGINGLLEAFLRATALPATFARMRYLMVVTSVVSIGVTFVVVGTLEMGVVGLITASVANVLVRIAVNLWLLSSYVSRAPSLVLQPSALGGLVGSVVAANALMWGMRLQEVPASLSVKGLGMTAAYAVLAVAIVAPQAYRIERRAASSVIFRK